METVDVQMLDSLLARNLSQALISRLGPALAIRQLEAVELTDRRLGGLFGFALGFWCRRLRKGRCRERRDFRIRQDIGHRVCRSVWARGGRTLRSWSLVRSRGF